MVDKIPEEQPTRDPVTKRWLPGCPATNTKGTQGRKQGSSRKAISDALRNQLDSKASDFPLWIEFAKKCELDPEAHTVAEVYAHLGLIHGGKGRGDYFKEVLNRTEGPVTAEDSSETPESTTITTPFVVSPNTVEPKSVAE